MFELEDKDKSFTNSLLIKNDNPYKESEILVSQSNDDPYGVDEDENESLSKMEPP